MAFFVKNFVVGTLDFSIFPWRNDRLYTRIFCAFDNFVRVVATIDEIADAHFPIALPGPVKLALNTLLLVLQVQLRNATRKGLKKGEMTF